MTKRMEGSRKAGERGAPARTTAVAGEGTRAGDLRPSSSQRPTHWSKHLLGPYGIREYVRFKISQCELDGEEEVGDDAKTTRAKRPGSGYWAVGKEGTWRRNRKDLALDLSHWPLTDGDISEISSEVGLHCWSGRRVRSLTLRGCQLLTDAAIPALWALQRGRPLGTGLSDLDVSECLWMRDAACIALGEGLPRLERLDISGCRGLTDRGVVAVMDGCRYLESFRLRNLSRFTDAGMDIIRRNVRVMKMLRELGEQ